MVIDEDGDGAHIFDPTDSEVHGLSVGQNGKTVPGINPSPPTATYGSGITRGFSGTAQLCDAISETVIASGEDSSDLQLAKIKMVKMNFFMGTSSLQQKLVGKKLLP